ncbi:barstar family protein [Streptomyces sp. NBC_01520]|uniref:barstar family protein n=1 Tax=Streptomyces sp. NBC_01520 TaxID=2903892 RepID=UPI00386BB749
MSACFAFSFQADDDEDTPLGSFVDLDNFFIGSSNALSEFGSATESGLDGGGFWLNPRLVDLTPTEALREYWASGSPGERHLGNAWIIIHGAHGKMIGSYFVGSVSLDEWVQNPDQTVTVTLSCWVNVLPEGGAGSLWKSWGRHAPTSMNGWVDIPLGQRESWVEVSRMYGMKSRRAKNSDGRYVLCGENIHDLASFYCAIGEAMNGPGGYYGCNLAALDDCLFGGHGPAAPFRLVWQESAVAMNSLGTLPTDIDNKKVLGLILECFERRGVSVELT